MHSNFTDSVVDLNYTRTLSKMSCHRSFYFVHVTCSYLVFLSGIVCFITRIWPRYQWLHVIFGRIFIVTMLWTTAASVLINNTGLPIPVLMNFAYIMAALPIAWFVIKWYQHRMDVVLTDLVNANLKESVASTKGTPNIKKLYETERTKILNGLTWKQKFFSLKTLHGVLMMLAWWGISGRMFFSNQSGDFTCHTYPVYKPIDADMGGTAGMNLGSQPLVLVPELDPEYNRLPWAGQEALWAIQGFFSPVLIALLVALIYTYCSTNRTPVNGLNRLMSS